MASETCAPDCAERTACPVVGEPGHWQCGTCPKHKEPRHHCGCLAAPSPVDTTEPLAETQQDEEHRHVWWNGTDRPYYCRSCGEPRPALAARPSADTEALDRMRAAVERAIPVDVVPRINFDWLMRDLRAALDGGR